MDQEKLSDHIYGHRHELIGKPCLFLQDGDLKPAIPYGAYRLNKDAENNVEDYKKGKSLLTIAYFDPKSLFEGENVHVKAMSGVSPDDLIPVDPSSKKAQEISHVVLGWLISHRDGVGRKRLKGMWDDGKKHTRSFPNEEYHKQRNSF